MNKVLAGLTIAGALAISGAAHAHHSFVAFNNAPEAETSREGVVTQWAWINPHPLMEFSVSEGGKNVLYVMELPSGGYLIRKGWKKDSAKPGDKVKVTFAPLKDGRPGGLLQGLVVNGKALPAIDPNPGRFEGTANSGGPGRQGGPPTP